MFAGRSMGKAFRPSRFSNELETQHLAEAVADREKRIRRYARRAQLRLPVFESQPAAQSHGGELASV